MKIKNLSSIILAAMMTATSLPATAIIAPYSNLSAYAVETVASEEVTEETPEIIAEGICGVNLKWKIESAENALVISGYGEMTKWEKPEDAPWAEYGDSIEMIIVRPGVGEISENSFELLTNVAIVYMTSYDCLVPDSETAIPEKATILGYTDSNAHAYAVKYGREFIVLDEENGEYPVAEGLCGSLEWTLWSNGKIAFYSYGDIKAENGVYPWDAFAESIKSVVINTCVRSIGENAFTKCENLESVSILTPDCIFADSADILPSGIELTVDSGSTAEAYAKKFELEHTVIEYGKASGKIGENLSWLLFDYGYLRIYGEGDMIDLGGANPWGEYEDEINYVQINEEVTSIDESAFEGCENIKEILVINPDCKFVENEAAIPEDALIRGTEGSEALNYAMKFGRTFKTLMLEEKTPEENPEEAPETESEYVAAGIIENFKWTLDKKGNLEISGEGGISESQAAEQWGKYADDVVTVTIAEKVTSIGGYKFSNFKNAVYIRIKNFKFDIPDVEGMFPEDVEIVGSNGSIVQKYAEKYGVCFRNFKSEIHWFGYEGRKGNYCVDEQKLVNNIYWKLWNINVLSINGKGEMPELNGEYSWNSYADKVENVEVNRMVKNINEDTLAGFDNLKGVLFVNADCVIPDSETAIPEGVHISGFKGSTAEAYAEKYGREFSVISNTEISSIAEGTFGENDEITWRIHTDGDLYIYGDGELPEFTDGCPWDDYAEEITEITIEKNIDYIPDKAFYNCKNAKYISFDNPRCMIADSPDVIPDNTVIGGYGHSVQEAYAKKYNREMDYYDYDAPIIGGVYGKGSGNIGDNVEWHFFSTGELKINGYYQKDDYTLYDSNGIYPWDDFADEIKIIRINDEITTLGNYSFINCTKAHIIEVENPDLIIPDVAGVFPEDTEIHGYPDSTVHEYAKKYNLDFKDFYTYVEENKRPDDVHTTGAGPLGFDLHWELLNNGELFIDFKGEMIDKDAIYPWQMDADAVKNIHIGKYVKNISENAFDTCLNVESVSISGFNCVIADSEKAIPEGAVIYGYKGSTAEAYAEKYNREFRTIGETEQEEIKGSLFGKFPYEINEYGEMTIDGEGALEAILRSSIALDNSDKVEIVTLSEGITSIGNYNFFNCKNLRGINLGKAVERIGDYAFYGCYNLSTLDIENPDCVIADSPYVFPEKMVIFCHEGSTAEAYAKKYNREYHYIQHEVAKGVIDGGAEWQLMNDGALYVRGNEDGTSDITDCDGANFWGEYADMITYVVIDGNIGKIGDYAFYNCKNLTEAYLSGIVGEHAFEGCEKLEYVSASGTELYNYAFSGCEKLESIYIDDSVKLTDSADIFPEGITISGTNDTIKAYAEKYGYTYEDCALAAQGDFESGLSWFLANNGVMNINGWGEIPDGEGENLWGEFADKLTYVFSSNVEGIGDYAFYNCKNLEVAGIFNANSKPIAKIGSHAFEGCEKLGVFEVTETVERIGNYAFYGCTNLTEISIANPDCVIADSEFTIPENTVIYGYKGSTAEAYAEKYNRKFVVGEGFETKLIDEGKLSDTIEYTLTEDGILTITGEGDISDLENSDFWGSVADDIKTIELSGEIVEIGDFLFAGCENLESVNVPVSNKLAVIGAHAFENCKNLKAFPFINVSAIEDYAFNGCESLENAVIANPECEIADSEYTFSVNTVITALAGSKAEKYAEKYDRTFETALEITFGDVNMDGMVDSSDASRVLSEYAALQTGEDVTLTEKQTKTADVNKDGVVDSSDASKILGYYAALSTGKEPTWD